MFVSFEVMVISLLVSFVFGLVSPVLFMLYCVMRAEVPQVVTSRSNALEG